MMFQCKLLDGEIYVLFGWIEIFHKKAPVFSNKYSKRSSVYYFYQALFGSMMKQISITFYVQMINISFVLS